MSLASKNLKYQRHFNFIFLTSRVSICNLCIHLGGSGRFLHRSTMQQNPSFDHIPLHGTYDWSGKVSAAVKYDGPCIADNLSHRCVGIMVDSIRVRISWNGKVQIHPYLSPVFWLRPVHVVHGELALRMPSGAGLCHRANNAVIWPLRIRQRFVYK